MQPNSLFFTHFTKNYIGWCLEHIEKKHFFQVPEKRYVIGGYPMFYG